MNQLTLTDHPYLYLGSLSEAKRSNEAGLWRASHQCNIACKQAIEAAIRAGFDGMHLKADCARGVIAQYGFKRVGWVLANTIQKKRWTAGSVPATRSGPTPSSSPPATGQASTSWRATQRCWTAS